jgi:UDP-glucose 4-epimerase
MNIVITGGTGFIGSHVVKRLCGPKNTVTILARNPSKVPSLKALPGVKIIDAPMTDAKAQEKALKKADALIHIALCWGDTAVEMLLNETLPSVHLLETAGQLGVKKVIFTSSTAATGYAPERIDETTFRAPDDNYGATKGSVELFAAALSRKYPKTAYNIIRPGYVFGNPCIPGGSIQADRRFHNICRAVKHNERIVLPAGDGTQFIWAGHLAELFARVLSSNCRNEIFFGLGRKFIPWHKIAGWAVELSGSGSRVMVTGKSGKPHLFVLSKIRRYFGLSFDAEPELKRHLKYLLATA